MSEFKHTPGPWEYVPSTENHGAYVVTDWGSDVADCYTMSNPKSAAVCNGGDSKPVPFQGDQSDANARLIAAAPEMVELLARVSPSINGAFLAGTEECEGGSARRQGKHMAEADALVKEIRALLSKIKGEEQ